MRRNLPILSAVCLLALYGLAEGVWSHRWQPSHELEEAVARLRNVPLTVGEWQGKEEQLPGEGLQQTDMAGYLMRSYVNRRTYQSVQVLIICGAPGPTSVHTPDVCYRGAGFSLQGQTVRHSEKLEQLAAPAELWTAEFHKPQGLLTQQLRIYWTWTVNGEWVAPGNPRWQFAGQQAVFKLYLIRPTFQTGGSARDEVCMEFLQDFLPQLNQILFPAVEPKN